ncbi:hypothetical protein ACFX1X_022657 [Malus domestica]
MPSQRSLSSHSVFLIPWGTPANKGLQSKSISYHQGRKQEYLISCTLPVLSFVLVPTYKDKDKENNMPELPLKLG